MFKRKSWEEFRQTGLLWFTNSILHAFGWALVYEYDEQNLLAVYPARTTYRGFDVSTNDTGYRNIAAYLVKHAEILDREAKGISNKEQDVEATKG